MPNIVTTTGIIVNHQGQGRRFRRSMSARIVAALRGDPHDTRFTVRVSGRRRSDADVEGAGKCQVDFDSRLSGGPIAGCCGLVDRCSRLVIPCAQSLYVTDHRTGATERQPSTTAESVLCPGPVSRRRGTWRCDVGWHRPQPQVRCRYLQRREDPPGPHRWCRCSRG